MTSESWFAPYLSFPFTMSTHCADDSPDSMIIEPASDFSSLSSPTWSISSENENEYYNNQLHYYEEHGWPEVWGPGIGPQLHTATEIICEPKSLVVIGNPDGDARPTIGDLSCGKTRVSLTSYCLASWFTTGPQFFEPESRI